MADQFITEIANQATTLQTSDLLVVETGIGGTPETKTIDWTHLESLILDFQNYQIIPSVSSNNLSLAIKNRDGTDFNATESGKMRIGNSLYALTASISFTKNAGTNWCNAGSVELAAKPIDFFVYAIGETGGSAGVKFGFSRIPYARTMGDFVNTTTNEKYIAGNWTNFNSSDAVTVIGRFRAQLSASASFNWSIASSVVVNRPIYETDWLSYSGQVSASTGTITTVGTVVTNYRVVGRGMDFEHDVTITTNGTGAGFLKVSLPFTPATNYQVAAGFNTTTGLMLLAQTLTTFAYYTTYAAAYPVTSGQRIVCSGAGFRLA